MRTTAWMLGWILAACTLGVASGTLAQDPPPEPQPAEPQGETPAAEAPSGEQNAPWWGGRNMLFLEFCGPRSETLAWRWTDATTLTDVELELGTSELRAETADGEVVIYGDLRLIFSDGRLAGCERKKPS